jgi:acyl dehydratase
MRKKYWDDFKEGEKVKSPAITITESHLVQWAGLTMDFYPLHMDEEYAKQTVFKGRVAHGPLTFAISVGLMFLSNIYEDSIVAWVGLENMTIPNPVKIGDTIHVEATVKEKRSTKNNEKGVIILRYVIKNQKETIVMAFDYIILMHKRG